MSDDIPVQALRAAAYQIPTEVPEADGTLSWDKTVMVVVEAEAGGQRGIGWTYSTPAAAGVVTGVLTEVVAGRPALDVPGTNEAMYRAVRNLGRRGIAAAAISAADIALWDLKARLLGISVTSLLGHARPVPVYGSGGFTSYDNQQLRDQLSRWTGELKIPRVKIKIGESWGTMEDRDLQRIELAREVIGPQAELFVDANGGYTVLQAAEVAKQMAGYRVSWFEEPVSSDDLTGLAALRAELELDVAAGEYSWTLEDSAALIGARAVDCLQVDVTRCGGVTGFLAAAQLAAAHELEVSGHCAPNLHARAAAGVANLRHVEYFHDHERIEQLLFDGALSPAGGCLTPDNDAAGLGLTLREADAARYRCG
jgi:L-alanine-DL-glutamate epimerase-like enolase superfamily enzyme